MSDPNQEFHPPPLFAPKPEPPAIEMSMAGTLTGIFFEPGRVFEALRSRPRFLAAGLVLLLLTIGVTALVYQRIDMAQYIRDKMEKSPRNASSTPEQKEMGVKFGKSIGAVGIPASVPITIAVGGALYLLGGIAFGGYYTNKKMRIAWGMLYQIPADL